MSKALVAVAVISAVIVIVSGAALGGVRSSVGGLALGAWAQWWMVFRGGRPGHGSFELVTQESERYRRALNRAQLVMAVGGVVWVLVVVWVIGGLEWLTLVLAALGVPVVMLVGWVTLKSLLARERRRDH